MSLEWRMPGIKVEEDPFLKKYLEIMVFGTMAVDIGEVSEKTLDEWLFRTEVLRKLHQRFGSELAPTGVGFVDVYPDEAMLRKFFGLRTNVSNLTRATWLKNVWKSVVRDCERDAKYRREVPVTQENAG